MKLNPLIVCPETLGPLRAVAGGFWSPRANRLYPERDGLVFMGYPARDAEMIGETMKEEREHQGLGVEVAERNLEYLREAAPAGVEYINTILPFVAPTGQAPRALELGSGNGWFSWLLAEAGFDTWLCDFEANSLATGLNIEHPNLGEGKRFVTDARFAPFASSSMDLVVFKEFVHHVADFKALFREAGRVLVPGGTMAFMEPVMSAWKKLYEIRHPDPHEGHHITWPDSYLRATRRSGMEIVFQTQQYIAGKNNRPLAAWMQGRAEAAIDGEHPSGNWVSALQLRLLGGAHLIVVARKAHEVPDAERPPMALIDPAALVLSEGERAAYREFPDVLAGAAEKLHRISAR